MTASANAWAAANDAYNRAAVRAVRAALELAAAEADPPPEDRPPWWWPFGRRSRARRVDRAALDSARAELGHTRPYEPALVALGTAFALSSFDRLLVALCVAAELVDAVDPLCARAVADPRRPYPNVNVAVRIRPLVADLFCGRGDGDWTTALAPTAPLRHWRLVDVTQPAGTGTLAAAVRIDPRVLAYILRDRERLGPEGAGLDVALAGPDHLLPDPTTDSPPERVAAADRVAAAWAAGRRVHLTGPDAYGKRAVVARAAAQSGLTVLRLPADRLPTAAADLDDLARTWDRERRLFPLALFLDSPDDTPSPLAGRVDGPVAVAADFGPRAVGPADRIEVVRSGPRQQAALWAAALESAPAVVSGRLAAQFDLEDSAIRAITAASTDAVRDRAAEDYWSWVLRAAWDRCREATRPRVDGLAERVLPPADWAGHPLRWKELTVPKPIEAQLDELVAQVENRWLVYDQWGLRDRLNRGLGVAALFAGDSGTGKTTAAGAVADNLRLDLYRIDLSAVVNKYIGETEKNLRRVFDAFEPGGAVLFFDECDALFGKRTDVKDSHDRYANIEVSYLLQRLEAYRGLVILATNNRGAVDAAFLRRLRFVVTFPTPEREDREAIWRRLLPEAGAPPTDRLDYARLARFDKLTGGGIQAAAVRATFLAAAQPNPRAVTMDDALRAVKAEYAKMNQPLRDADLDRPLARRPAAAGGVG